MASEIFSGFMSGLCSLNDSYIVTLEVLDRDYLCLYEVQETLPLLDSAMKLDEPLSPRSDDQGHIYVPHKAGVAVIRIVDNRYLHMDRILTGGGKLKSALGVAVVNDTTLCVTVAGEHNTGVYLLDVTSDTVLIVLQIPSGLQGKLAYGVASLSGSVLVNYDSASLVLYNTGEICGTLLPIEGLISLSSIAVDSGGGFLIADRSGDTGWVLSVTGEVLARVKSDCPEDVTLDLENRRLYIGSFF